jgi:outer membrane protein
VKISTGLTIVALVLAASALGLVAKLQSEARKFAFVDSQRLLTAFKEANQVNKEVEAEDKKWRAAMKTMEDSLKAFMDTMTVRYDKSSLKERRDLEDELAMRNQQINNFQKVNVGKMQELSREKLAKVYGKVDAFMKEYGKARGFDVIFGTSQGSILFGEGSPADITDEVIRELNKRYE